MSSDLAGLYGPDGTTDVMAIARAVLAVGGQFADAFVSGRRQLDSDNAAEVAAEIRRYRAGVGG